MPPKGKVTTEDGVGVVDQQSSGPLVVANVTHRDGYSEIVILDESTGSTQLVAVPSAQLREFVPAPGDFATPKGNAFGFENNPGRRGPPAGLPPHAGIIP